MRKARHEGAHGGRRRVVHDDHLEFVPGQRASFQCGQAVPEVRARGVFDDEDRRAQRVESIVGEARGRGQDTSRKIGYDSVGTVTKAASSNRAERVRRYFDRRGPSYRATFSRGFLGWLRARERTELYRLLDAKPGERLLDAGAGPGLDATVLQRRGMDVLAVDLSPVMVAELERAGIRARVADLEELDLPERFDKILCAGSLEFCARPERAVERLAHHLVPGGRIVVLYPLATRSGRAYWLYHRLHGTKVHLFAPEELRRLLRRAGLEPRASATPTPFSGVESADRC